MLLHIFGHIESYHRVLVAEERVGKRFAKLRFAYTRRTEENKRTGRAFGIFEPDSAAPYRPRDRADRLILTDYSAVQLIFKMKQAFALRLSQLRDGYSSPRADYFGYIICRDLTYFLARFLAPAVLCALEFVAQLLLLVAYLRGVLELLRIHRRVLFLGEGAESVLHIFEIGRHCECTEPDARRRLVY